MLEKLIIIMLGQAGIGILALVKLYFSNERLKERVKEIETRNEKLADRLKELNDTMIVVKQNTELLLLGRIKTGKAE